MQSQSPEVTVNTIQRQCETCQTVFEAAIKEVNRGYGRFCSRSCSARRKRLAKESNCECDYCGRDFYRVASKLTTKSGYIFCSRECKELAQSVSTEGFERLQPHHYNDGSSSYRRIAFRYHVNVCNRCGWCQEVDVLEVHHKDRDRLNNRLDNLEILCPTCHQLEHFCAGDGRWRSNVEEAPA